MPWFIRKEDDKFCVVKGTREEPLEVEACHDTEAEAIAQMRALYASEEKAAQFKRYTLNGVTCQATARRSSDREDKAWARTVRYDDSERVVHYADPDMPMRRNDEDARAAFNARHNCELKKDPFAPGFWACYDWNNPDEKSTDVLVAFGSSVKVLGEDGTVGGYLVQFTDETKPDLEGDYFDAQTEYGPHDKSIVFYQHGMDDELGRKPLKNLASIKVTDTGVWFEHQLDLRDQYEKLIYQLAQQGKLGLSSGTASHLVEREPKGDFYHITKWFLGVDASYTPNPANPHSNVMPLKTYLQSLSGDKPAEQPEAKADQEADNAVSVDGRERARIKAKIIDTILED